MANAARFRPFRSRAFWVGVPGLVFLLWAWADSMRHGTSILGNGRVGGMVTQVWGEACFAVWRDSSATEFLGFEMKRDARPDESSALRFKLLTEVDLAWMIADEPPRWIWVRHDVVLLGYSFLWSALMAWRWRTFHRAFRETREE